MNNMAQKDASFHKVLFAILQRSSCLVLKNNYLAKKKHEGQSVHRTPFNGLNKEAACTGLSFFLWSQM